MLHILHNSNAHVACSKYGEEESCIQDWWGDLRERGHLKDTVIVGRLILRWIFRKWDVVVWTGFIWCRTGADGSFCECGNEPLGSMKCGEFVDPAEGLLACQEGVCYME